MTDPYKINNLAELIDAIGDPIPELEVSIFDHLDEEARFFIHHSPLMMLSTSDAAGNLDVSPKGDEPGFVIVENNKTLLLPDRPGNKMVLGFRNILETGKVGLIFVIPGVKETLRVNGTAEITRDPKLLKRLAANGKLALLCTRITVEECFIHCGKAMILSKLWQADSWPEGIEANLVKQFATKKERRRGAGKIG